jgi:hypothetical protein
MDDGKRLASSAHELGHATVLRDLGIRVVAIRIVGEGDTTAGYTEAAPSPVGTTEEIRHELLGTLAGPAAGHRWCEENQVRLHPRADDGDHEIVRALLRNPLAAGLDLALLRLEARELVRANWGQIRRYAPILCERGRLTL